MGQVLVQCVELVFNSASKVVVSSSHLFWLCTHVAHIIGAHVSRQFFSLPSAPLLHGEIPVYYSVNSL